jgi:hypothetical protein
MAQAATLPPCNGSEISELEKMRVDRASNIFVYDSAYLPQACGKRRVHTCLDLVHFVVTGRVQVLVELGLLGRNKDINKSVVLRLWSVSVASLLLEQIMASAGARIITNLHHGGRMVEESPKRSGRRSRALS